MNKQNTIRYATRGTVGLGGRTNTGGAVNYDYFNLTKAPALSEFLGTDKPKEIPIMVKFNDPMNANGQFDMNFGIFGSDKRVRCMTCGVDAEGRLVARREIEGNKAGKKENVICPWTWEQNGEEVPRGNECKLMKEAGRDGKRDKYLCRPSWALYFFVPGMDMIVPHVLYAKGFFFPQDIISDMQTIRMSLGGYLAMVPLTIFRAKRPIMGPDGMRREHWGIRIRVDDTFSKQLSGALTKQIEERHSKMIAGILGEGSQQTVMNIASPAFRQLGSATMVASSDSGFQATAKAMICPPQEEVNEAADDGSNLFGFDEGQQEPQEPDQRQWMEAFKRHTMDYADESGLGVGPARAAGVKWICKTYGIKLKKSMYETMDSISEDTYKEACGQIADFRDNEQWPWG